ncbi:MAG TPA: hypothetical protein VHI51_12080 [Ktedonobacterales bacterium]|jgi:hypothetical protein|nr:hypothetical protein [Ktedonobacterales bacterium]
MTTYPEAPNWDLTVRLEGSCRHCGADLSGEARVRATTDWVARYYADAAFQRVINQAIARRHMERHQRICPAERIAAQRQPAWAVSA